MNAGEVPCVLCQRESSGEPATLEIAASLARQCRSGDCILLNGDLGAGKTAFARGFIQALSPESVEITSPTFTLVQTYPARSGDMIWHFDLYRLKNTQELIEIGLDEALQSGITLMEWPQLASEYVPAQSLVVTITTGENPQHRQLSFSGLPSVWKDRLSTL